MSTTTTTTKTVSVEYDDEGRMVRESTVVVEESVGFVKMEVVNTYLFQFSEWLDSQGLVLGESASNDRRTHEELVRDFLSDGAA